MEGKAEAGIYIRFTRFRGEVREATEKHEKLLPAKSDSNDQGRPTAYRTASRFGGDVDRASAGRAVQLCGGN